MVLTHSVDSQDATALGQLVTRLSDQHGLAFVRDVADELVAELAEATSAIMPEEP